jgi:hypothetical protein
MKKTISALLTASLVVAFAFAFVGSVGAQTVYSTNTGSSLNSTTTDNSTGSGSASGSVSGSGSGSVNTTSTSTSSTSPGLPNTGAGGDAAMNFALLLSSGLIAVGATVLLARKLAA